jgi:hypothetical protein
MWASPLASAAAPAAISATNPFRIRRRDAGCRKKSDPLSSGLRSRSIDGLPKVHPDMGITSSPCRPRRCSRPVWQPPAQREISANFVTHDLESPGTIRHRAPLSTSHGMTLACMYRRPFRRRRIVTTADDSKAGTEGLNPDNERVECTRRGTCCATP